MRPGQFLRQSAIVEKGGAGLRWILERETGDELSFYPL